MARGRMLFISDLHLHAGLPAAIRQFEAFLDTEARDCSGLYILGDLFETWIGDDDDEAARDQVCVALKALTRSGVPCRVQHGNRDFLMGTGFVSRTGCELLADPSVLVHGGLRCVISHGDTLCTQDVGYQRLRKVVRNRAVQRPWLALPLGARRGLAAFARRRSHDHLRRKPEAILDVTPAAVEALLRTTGADVLIHGHTHRPGVHSLTVDGRDCARIVLGDWYEQGSVLALHADGSYGLRKLDTAMPAATAGTPE